MAVFGRLQSFAQLLSPRIASSCDQGSFTGLGWTSRWPTGSLACSIGFNQQRWRHKKPFHEPLVKPCEPGRRRLLVAMVGKVNTGKSTLFNKLTGRNHAIVSPVAGTTRDRSYGTAEWGPIEVDLIDTGGLVGENEGDPLQGRIDEQTFIAANEADVVLFLTDATTGIQPADVRIARLLKKYRRERGDTRPLNIHVITNKCDSDMRTESMAPQFVRLGFGHPIPVSAIHGTGLYELWDAIRPAFNRLSEAQSPQADDDNNEGDATDSELLEIDLEAEDDDDGSPSPSRSEHNSDDWEISTQLMEEEMTEWANTYGNDDDEEKEAEVRVVDAVAWGNGSQDDVIPSYSTELIPDGLVLEGESVPATESLYPKNARIALIGRPNCGKSTLLNHLLSDNRALVSDIPGTTIDPIDASLTWAPTGTQITLTDTAGIRRRSQQKVGIERTTCLWSERALQESDMGVLLFDCQEGFQVQDHRLLDLSIRELLRCTVVAVNKWDVLTERDPMKARREYEENIRKHIPSLPHVPIYFISALTGHGVEGLVNGCLDILRDRPHRFETRHLNKVIRQVEALHFGAGSGGGGNRRARFSRRPRIRFVTQASSRGIPTFALFVNDKSRVTPPYERFIEQTIRKYVHPYTGVPIQLVFRSSS